MRSVLRLTTFEEFELWLQSLQAYCRCAGQRLGTSKIDRDSNYRNELRAVVEVMGELIQRCPKVVEPEMEKTAIIDPSDSLRKAADQGPSARFAEFYKLWEFLQRYRVVGASMGRNSELSLREFQAYGEVLAGEIEAYNQSPTHEQLSRKYLFLKFQHLIDRDLVGTIEIDGVREELGYVFLDFLQILSYLDYFQNSIRHSFKYQRLFILLRYFSVRYQQLLRTLEQSHRYLGYSLPQLNQEVTSVRFALKMEIKRIFRAELKGVEQQQKLGEIYSRIETALGLLLHITQHSFIGLVRKLNPAFDDQALFEDVRDQQAEAFRLVSDLNQLYKLTVEAGQLKSDEVYQKVADEMDRFQAGSMRLLFFKDWEPVESFGNELREVEGDERWFVTHRLEVFLSALIGEVSKRAVLGAHHQAVGS